MKKIISIIQLSTIFFLVFACPTTSYSQPKSTTKSKSNNTSEIDKLYKLYNGKESIELFTPHGSLRGTIDCTLNDQELPVSVNIFGAEISNKAAVAEFLSSVISQKISQGYKPTKTPSGWGYQTIRELVETQIGWGHDDPSHFQILLRKGNMYFTADAWFTDERISSDFVTLYHFDISTTDSKREGGKGAEKFVF